MPLVLLSVVDTTVHLYRVRRRGMVDSGVGPVASRVILEIRMMDAKWSAPMLYDDASRASMQRRRRLRSDLCLRHAAIRPLLLIDHLAAGERAPACLNREPVRCCCSLGCCWFRLSVRFWFAAGPDGVRV